MAGRESGGGVEEWRGHGSGDGRRVRAAWKTEERTEERAAEGERKGGTCAVLEECLTATGDCDRMEAKEAREDKK